MCYSIRARNNFEHPRVPFKSVLLREWHYSVMRTERITTLKRQAAELSAYIERNKQLIPITQQGRPCAYLVDIEPLNCSIDVWQCWRG